MKKKKITYQNSGVDYQQLDPIKRLAQDAAKSTTKNLKKSGFLEIAGTRGESAYVWKQGNYLMASVIEGLGTKNLVADAVYKKTGKIYYNIIAQDTVATIINDLVSVGATPLVLHAYWAQSKGGFLSDPKRVKDFVKGWVKASNIAGVSWGGGETPNLSGIITRPTVDLGGSAVGIIRNKKKLISDEKLRAGDRIILIKSNGINANGLTLARFIAKRLSDGYETKLSNGKLYGESLLTPSNIYAKLVQDLQKENIDIHYITNITGHGVKKIMRGRPKFTYIVEKIFKPQPVFDFIKKHANLDDYEMYQTYNMGQDYAIFVPSKDVNRCLKIIKKNGFNAIDAGYIEKGEKQVIVKPKELVFKGETLDLR